MRVGAGLGGVAEVRVGAAVRRAEEAPDGEGTGVLRAWGGAGLGRVVWVAVDVGTGVMAWAGVVARRGLCEAVGGCGLERAGTGVECVRVGAGLGCAAGVAVDVGAGVTVWAGVVAGRGLCEAVGGRGLDRGGVGFV